MERNTLYKCDCGTIVEVCVVGETEPSCCGKAMTPLVANTVDAAKEKHVPVVEKIDGGYKVTVGSVPHPMTPEHYIALIELLADGQVLRQPLTPADKPEAVFTTTAGAVTAREYCNLHGLWSS